MRAPAPNAMPQHPAVHPGAELGSASASDVWWVVCLCAAWCKTCGDYRAAFASVAREWPGVRFEWVDIEDEADLVGDVDVETFPTVLIGDAQGARFLGPLLPQPGVLARLLSSLRDTPAGARALAGPEAQALLNSVRAARR